MPKKSALHPFIIRATAEQHAALQAQATQANMSLNKWCLSQFQSAGTSRAFEKNEHPQWIFQQRLENLPDVASIREYVTEVDKSPLGASLLGVVLYGSAARNELKATSDIDLLFVLRSGTSFDRDAYEALPIARISGRELSPTIAALPQKSDEVGSLWREIAIDGIILSDSQFTIASFLGKVRRQLVAGDMKRGNIQGVPYWRAS